MPRRYLALLVGVVLAVVAGAVESYRAQRSLVRARVESELAAIGRLKAEQIAAWRTEVLEEGEELLDRPLLCSRMVAFLEGGRATDRALLAAEFAALRRHDGYHAVVLTDAAERVALADGRANPHRGAGRALAEALAGGRPALSDLHVGEGDSVPHLSVVVPLRSVAGRPVGALTLVTDARTFLYPLVQSWPVPSPSAESYLVRRDGDAALILNDLRHRSGAAFTMRVPLTASDRAAAAVVRGDTGVMLGVDYRGIRVLSYATPVPGTPWFLVSKVDASEAFAAVRQRAVAVASVAAGLIALLGLGALALQQRHRRADYEGALQAEAARREGARRYRALFETNPNAMWVYDRETLRFLAVNDAAVARYGYTREEFLARTIEDIRPPEEVPRLRAWVAAAQGILDHAGIWRHRTKDGRLLDVEITSHTLDWDGRQAEIVLAADVTERRRAERDLLRANRALRTITECNQALVRATDEHGLFQAICEAAVRFGGYRMVWVGLAEDGPDRAVTPVAYAGDDAGYLAAARISWDDTPLGRGPTGTAIREGRPVVVRDIHADPAFEPWRAAAVERGYAASLALPLQFGGDRRMGALNIYAAEPDAFDAEELRLLTELASDLTFGVRSLRERSERDAALLALQATTGQLRHLLAASPTVLYSMRVGDDGLHPVEVSDNVVRILGYTVDEVLAPGFWAAHVHGDDRARALDAASRVLPDGHVEHEYRFACRDGRHIWVRDQLRLVRDATGTAVEVVGAWTDVTERREAEEALRQRERLLSDSQRVSHIGSWMLDQRTGVLMWTDEMYRIYGVERDAFGHTYDAFLALVHPEDRAAMQAWFESLLAGEAPPALEFRAIRADGGARTILGQGSVERDVAGRAVAAIGTAQDVTERVAAARERESLQGQLAQAQKMELVGRLAGGVAHDFNNMLTIILAHAEMALADMPPGEERAEDLRAIREAAQRSATLTRQLLGFSRRQTVAPRVLDLNETVGAMQGMLRRLMGEDVAFEWAPGRGPLHVNIDPSQLDQVLANLCVNARDAVGPTGRIAIGTGAADLDDAFCAAHEGARPGPYVVLSVSDDGTGIPPDVLPHIFEPFFTTKPVGTGTGLGLATVYGIARQNDGFVDVRSAPGAGATFRVFLPQAEAPVADGEPVEHTGVDRGRGETVLLVEDETMLLDLSLRMLQRLGYSVLRAESPDRALALATRHPAAIDLVVSDVVMPGMNGLDLARRMAPLQPRARFLFVSGYASGTVVPGGIMSEGTHFLPKPFTLQGLASKVREVLDGA